MKKYQAFSFFLLLSVFTSAQKHDKRLMEQLTSRPEYPGGPLAMMAFIQKYINYPPVERDKNIQGILVLRFLVNEKGEVKEPEVISSPSAGFSKEGMRIIKLLHNWKPAMYHKKPVPVYTILKVKFKIQQ